MFERLCATDESITKCTTLQRTADPLTAEPRRPKKEALLRQKRVFVGRILLARSLFASVLLAFNFWWSVAVVADLNRGCT